MRYPRVTFLIFGFLCGAFGQADPPARVFEVASVKPVPGPFSRMYIVNTSGPRFTAEACAVSELILYAYNVKNYQVSFAAPFAESETRYDILANAEGDAVPTKDEFRQMVRSLLADRFKLKVHREMKEMPVYAIVAAKNGPKLKESAPDAEHRRSVGVSGRNYQVTMRKVTMEEITLAIGNTFLDRPVVDKTELAGTYDATLTYTPNLRATREGEPDLNDISIFTAIQEQLGLRLAPQRAMVEILVVDHVEKASQN